MDNFKIIPLTDEDLEKMSKDVYEENKKFCTEMLAITLKSTRAFHNKLTHMEYVDDDGYEYVLCEFCYYDGMKEQCRINVTADSCIALIKDVFTKLYYDYT